MSSSSNEDRQEARRLALLRDAARTLATVPGASMAEIATELRVSRATLYRHFPSREELVREVALTAIRDSDDATAHIGVGVPTYRRAFELLFDAMIPLGARYHFLTGESQVMRDAMVAREVERQTRELRAMVAGAQANGELDADVPSAFVATLVDALIYVAWASVEQGAMTPDEAAAVTMRALWSGVGKGVEKS